MEDQTLELSLRECEILMELFRENLLRDNYRDHQGNHRTRIMRSRHIDIKDIRFAQKIKQERPLQKLLDQKIIIKDQIWYRFYLKKEYMKAIYNLADQGHWELITQMVGVWIEIQQEAKC